MVTLVAGQNFIWAGYGKENQSHPNRCFTQRESCSILGIVALCGRRFVRTAKTTCMSQEHVSLANPSGRSRGNFSPGVAASPPYFSALKRLDRRDLYRDAVFSCKTPFWIALSSADTVSR